MVRDIVKWLIQHAESTEWGEQGRCLHCKESQRHKDNCLYKNMINQSKNLLYFPDEKLEEIIKDILMTKDSLLEKGDMIRKYGTYDNFIKSLHDQLDKVLDKAQKTDYQVFL
jgi:hypothetical protein